MATIPIIPGVSVATKGILNKPIKDIVCALLFGGIKNGIKGPLLCVTVDLDKLIQGQFPGAPGLASLASELSNVRDKLKAAVALSGIPETLARVNAAVSEVQSLLALNGLCAIPLKAPKITDVISQVIDAEFNELNAILNELGRLTKPQLCLGGNGGITTGTYNSKSILGRIQYHINRMEDIPAGALAQLKTRLRGVGLALDKSINRQLFPDFRHKHDLTTGKPYVPGVGPVIVQAIPGTPAIPATPGTPAIPATPGTPYIPATPGTPAIPATPGTPAIPATPGTPAIPATPGTPAIPATPGTPAIPATPGSPEILSTTPGPTLAGIPSEQWNPPYPPADAPNLQQATETAQMLVANMSQTASYPIDVDGIRNENIWLAMLGPEVYAMAVEAMSPVDPLFTQQDPIYDYCGRLVGHTSTVITGDITAIGGDPNADAQLTPPLTNFSLNWINDRNCWGVTGVQSEQIVNGRKAVHLNANPTIEIHRGYNHTFSIPSLDISGNSDNVAEFFICYVDTNLTPRIVNGNVVPFNLGLARLETYELLEDANGTFDNNAADLRKGGFPTGTTLYLAAENRVYSGTTAPTTPSESVWWYNTITCLTHRWKEFSTTVYEGTGTDTVSWENITGDWIIVTNEDRANNWFGSSIVYNDPNVNYLAYSNKDGSAFGLLKFI